MFYILLIFIKSDMMDGQRDKRRDKEVNFHTQTHWYIELKAHNLPISVSKTNTLNFCIVTTCKFMSLYEITISKSFAN